MRFVGVPVVSRLRWLAGSAVLLGLLGLATTERATADPPPVVANGTQVPVLVELFTSEGCSSCPSAEDELSRLARTQPVPGVRIVPLAFHVDYWDDLGWPDPFASHAWTARQGEYVRRRGGSLYTPEAVVQGGPDCVGSDDHALRGLVSNAATASNAAVDVGRVTPRGSDLRVSVNVGALTGLAARERATLVVALTESGVNVLVPRGENRGRTLAHAPLARDVVTVDGLGAAGGAFDATLAVPSTSRRENLDVVAFIQAGRGGRVLGVGTTKVPLTPE